jgi:hypothetical protein
VVDGQKRSGAAMARTVTSHKLLLSYFSNLSGLRAFGALDYLKFDRVSFLQGAVAVSDDSRIMNKNIGTVFTPDEPVALRIVEPLYSSLHLAAFPRLK